MAAEPEGAAGWDGWLGPRIWAPAAAILTAALVVALVLFFRERSEAKTVVMKCEPGDPGCELRQKIHEHADFALFVRGQRFDFGKPEFISDEKRELSENVHIHNPRHTVIHVHREQTTWDELFASLGFELTDTCIRFPGGESYCNGERETLKFVVNGVRSDKLMFSNIHGMERVLISYGSESDEQLTAQYAQVTDQACIPSGLCTARGTGVGEHGEPEPCSGGGNTCN